MMGEDPNQDPLAVPGSEHRHWPEAFWPGPSPQNQLPELKTEPGGHDAVIRHCLQVLNKEIVEVRRKLYQRRMGIACAAGNTEAGGRLLLR